jgi:hypothetical protein
MSVVLTALTVAAALGERAVIGSARRIGRYLKPASAFLLLMTGAYVVYYWLTAGGLLGR